MKSCYLCGKDEYKCRDGKVRDNDNLDILECKNCGLVSLSDFSHIEENFYENTGMHKGQVDIDQWLIATESDNKSRFEELKDKIKGKKVLDFGCGNGGFLMNAKNTASYVAGIDLDKSLAEHFQNEEIKLYSNIDDIEEKFDIITMFHVIEHLDKPDEVLTQLSSKLNKGGKIIIETPNSDDALLKLYKSKAFSKFTYWSCHLYLFNEKTLSKVIKKTDLKITRKYQKQRYPLSNHLYWLIKGKPGGHQKWQSIDSFVPFYENLLAPLKMCDTVMMEVSL